MKSPLKSIPACVGRRAALAVALVAVFSGLPAAARAQARPSAEMTTRTGTLVEFAKQGRLQSLKFTDESGDEQELAITPRIRAEVEAQGDSGFLRQGQFIACIATETRQQLFADEVSVVLFEKGRVPAGRIAKAPRKEGQSLNAYQVTGTINAIGQDPDYPEYQRVELNAAGPKAPLMLKQDVKVTVKSGDLSLAPAGTPIEFEGVELKNGRFNLAKVTLKLAEPLKVEDVLKDAEAAKESQEPKDSKESKAE